MRRLILAAITLLASCTPALAPAQAVTAPQPINTIAAVTIWDCRLSDPTVLVDRSLDSSVWRPVILAHEEEHVRQALAVGCAAFHNNVREPGIHLANEVAAYCIGARVAVKLHLFQSLDLALQDAAGKIADDPFVPTPTLTAYELLRARCGQQLSP